MFKAQPGSEEYEVLRITLERSPGRFSICFVSSTFEEERRFGEGQFRLPLDPAEVESILARVYGTSQLQIKRSGGYGDLGQLRDIGSRLFAALFEGSLENLYRRTQETAWQQGKGLLIRLESAPPDLAAMPWEFLYDGRDFVNLSAGSTLVRAAAPATDEASQPISLPLHLLGLVAREYAQNEETMLHDLHGPATGFEVKVLGYGSTPEDVRRALRQRPVHIFHAILPHLTDQEVPRHADVWREVLHDAPLLRLLVLSADTSYRLAGELASAVPAVIGIRREMSEAASFAFLGALYRGIAAGQTLPRAVIEGRRAINLLDPGSQEWGLPVVYMRPNNVGFPVRPTDASEAESLSYDLPPANALPDDPNRQREWKKLMLRYGILERNLRDLESRRSSGRGPAVTEEIQAIQDQMAAIKKEMDQMSL